MTVGTFVANVMNRHPAVLARMATTLQVVSGGRLILGIGIGGHPAEHRALGIPFPDAPERVARLEEAVAVLRALWTGGPVPGLRRSTRSRTPSSASADPAAPIVIGGETPAGARLAGRIGDGWTAFEDNFEANLPVYLEALEATGRRARRPARHRRLPGSRLAERRAASPAVRWVEAPRETWARWQAAGADGAIVTVRTTADVDALVAATDRW